MSDFSSNGCLICDMHPLSDADLVRDYATHFAEAAFRELVSRHTDLVYSAALRQTGSPDIAREIVQSVFTDLARKARPLSESLPPSGSLTGWLYRATRFAVLKTLRDECRRQAHERLVMEHLDSNPPSEANWEDVAPALDEAMSELGDFDREAVLLRYFENQNFRTMGETLGISDDAAQKRVSRAVERLRQLLAGRGIAVGASGLALLVSQNAIQAAPAGLALSISTTVLSTASAVAPFTLTLSIMKLTTPKLAILLIAALLVGGSVYFLRDQAPAPQTAETVPLTTNEMLYREMLDAYPIASEVVVGHPTQMLWQERRDALLEAGYIETRDIPLPKPLSGYTSVRTFFDNFQRRFHGVEMGIRGVNRGVPPVAYVTARKSDFGPKGAIEQFIRTYNPDAQLADGK